MRILCGMMLLLGMVAPMSRGQGASDESAEKLRKTAHTYYMRQQRSGTSHLG
jgi:hypothetical protein